MEIVFMHFIYFCRIRTLFGRQRKARG